MTVSIFFLSLVPSLFAALTYNIVLVLEALVCFRPAVLCNYLLHVLSIIIYVVDS
jgi:hypothetical protein